VAATTIVAPRTAPTVAAKAAPSVVAKAAPSVVAKAAPTVVAKAAPTVLPRVTAKPAATPRAVPSQPAPAPSAAPSTETAGTSRQTWLDRAARDHQKASADRRNHFTIQLELACETQTLVDAWKHDRPAGTMWLLTSTYEGKTCFRVLWGRYPSKEAARRALAGIPSFFSSNHNRPVITAIR
jgi:septal ring-binding cell division protein DamX